MPEGWWSFMLNICPVSAAAVEMPVQKSTLLCLGFLVAAGGTTLVLVGLHFHSQWTWITVGLVLGMGGIGLLVSGLCKAMKNLDVSVPGHFLLHPRTGTRFSPQQALSIQRRLDRIRREMSTDSVTREPETEALPPPPIPLPSTPPPWTMEPPPSYDTVMKNQEQREVLHILEGIPDGAF